MVQTNLKFIAKLKLNSGQMRFEVLFMKIGVLVRNFFKPIRIFDIRDSGQ